MKIFKSVSRLALLTSIIFTATAYAEVAVIVSAANGNSALDGNTISRIFLGKTSKFPDGSQAIPVDQNEGSATRDAFNDQVLGKSASQLKAYWSRLIFTGKGTPPKESGNDADIKNLVAQNPNLIGYVDTSVVDESVKVVHKF
ncbi:MAG: phosphate ABC transporter substrate-binding protein [Oceanospirillaceae bacterium]|nr:phosphate ABC transporter substrate-binding protein [Oceanospirillaceae bacterium]MBT10715.1 phosphate ABC transporter substrate-binding protein [Oceanospirillaceae bacterium]|tara:strand:+ start:42025 stop:42453 length:429 start_codon:yes stop_codon:yes gene_type:complete